MRLNLAMDMGSDSIAAARDEMEPSREQNAVVVCDEPVDVEGVTKKSAFKKKYKGKTSTRTKGYEAQS